MKNPEAKSLLHCQIQAKHPPLPRLLPGCTRPRPGSSGAAPARTPLLRGCTRPFPFSSGATPARTPAPGSPAAAEGRPAHRPGHGPRGAAGPGWPGSPRERVAPNIHLHDSLFQPVVHEPRGSGLHRAPQGLQASRGLGSSQGCPRRSPGR